MKFLNYHKLISSLMLFFVSTHLLSNSIPYGNYLEAFFLTIIIVLSFKYLNKSNRFLTVSLFLVGSLLIYKGNGTVINFVNAINKNSGLISLFILIPLLGAPLFFDDYPHTISQVCQRYIKNKGQFYGLAAVSTHGVGLLLNLAAIPIVYDLLLDASLKFKAKDSLIIALIRGFVSCVFWSPNFVAVAVITYYLNLSWLSIVPTGIILSLVTLAIGWLENNRLPISQKNSVVSNTQSNIDWQKFWILIIIIFSLLSSILFLNILTKLSILEIIPLVALTFPLISAIFLGKTAKLRHALSNYYHNSLFKTKNEVNVFAAAGFFGYALSFSKVDTLILHSLKLQNIGCPTIIVAGLIAIISLIAIIGVHPIVTVSALATSFQASTMGLSQVGYAHTLLAGWGLGVLLSPFSGVVLLSAGISNNIPLIAGPINNWRYVFVSWIIVSLLIPLF